MAGDIGARAAEDEQVGIELLAHQLVGTDAGEPRFCSRAD
jgi:hypothetical protein